VQLRRDEVQLRKGEVKLSVGEAQLNSVRLFFQFANHLLDF